MRKMILGAASALALASPAVAADLQVTPYSEVPSYERDVHPYAYRTAPPVIVEEPAPRFRSRSSPRHCSAAASGG